MDVPAIMGQLAGLLRDLLMGQMLNDLSGTKLPAGTAEKLSEMWSKTRIQQAISQISEMTGSRSVNKKLDAEMCLIRLAGYSRTEGREVKEKIARPAERSEKKDASEKTVTKTEKKTEEKKPVPQVAEKSALSPAESDPRWAKLLGSIDNPLLKEALTGAYAKTDGDMLIIESDDPFILGVIKQADKQITALYPGGVSGKAVGKQENKALDALIESAGELITEE
jgi:DNA polymerase III gamma/tau subunit